MQPNKCVTTHEQKKNLVQKQPTKSLNVHNYLLCERKLKGAIRSKDTPYLERNLAGWITKMYAWNWILSSIKNSNRAFHFWRWIRWEQIIWVGVIVGRRDIAIIHLETPRTSYLQKFGLLLATDYLKPVHQAFHRRIGINVCIHKGFFIWIELSRLPTK